MMAPKHFKIPKTAIVVHAFRGPGKPEDIPQSRLGLQIFRQMPEWALEPDVTMQLGLMMWASSLNFHIAGGPAVMLQIKILVPS